MDANDILIEEAIDAVHHFFFKVDLLGDKTLMRDLEDTTVEHLMYSITSDLNAGSRMETIDSLSVVCNRIMGANAESYMFHSLAVEAGIPRMQARLNAAVVNGDFE
jgi:hypothetical protein